MRPLLARVEGGPPGSDRDFKRWRWGEGAVNVSLAAVTSASPGAGWSRMPGNGSFFIGHIPNPYNVYGGHTTGRLKSVGAPKIQNA